MVLTTIFLSSLLTGCLDERADKPEWIPVAKVSAQNGANKSGGIALEWKHGPWTVTESAEATNNPFGNSLGGTTGSFQINYSLPVGIE